MDKPVGGYPSKKEYNRARRRLVVEVFFQSEAQLEALKQRAKAAGYQRFSPWVLQMVLNASSGSVYQPEFVEGLKQESERLRRWLETTREEAEEYRRQVRLLQEQRDRLLLLVQGLPSGAEVTARFLQQGVIR